MSWLLSRVATNLDPHWVVEEWDRENNPGAEPAGGCMDRLFFDTQEEAEKYGREWANDIRAQAAREEAR